MVAQRRFQFLLVLVLVAQLPFEMLEAFLVFAQVRFMYFGGKATR